MAGHKAHTAHLEQALNELQAVTRALEDALADADAAVDRLHAEWAGEGASAHKVAHDHWAAEAKKMHEAVDGMTRVLNGARNNYEAATKANREMWS